MKLVGLMHCSHLVVVETVIIKSMSFPCLDLSQVPLTIAIQCYNHAFPTNQTTHTRQNANKTLD